MDDALKKQFDTLRNGIKSKVSHIESMLAGSEMKKEFVPVLPTECVFGKWYYNEGREFEAFATYKRLEIPHDNQHILYLRIFNLLAEDPDVSTIGKFFGKDKTLKDAHREEAEQLLPHLRTVNKQILELIDALEDEVKVGISKRKAPVEPSVSKKESGKYSEVNRMLESLEIKINQDLK